MSFLIKFVDKWSKDIVLLEKITAHDVESLEQAINRLSKVAGKSCFYEILNITGG